ncbi:MAG: hypothetical protein U0573_02830 [Phycisphaerales bacterium]|nr:hypothetical protein [Planctomycetota bacterium]
MAHVTSSRSAYLLLAIAGSQYGLASPIFQTDDTRRFNFAGGLDFSLTENDGQLHNWHVDVMTISRSPGAALPSAGTPIFLDHDEHVTMVAYREKKATRASMDASIQELLSADPGNAGPDTNRLFRAENIRSQALDMNLQSARVRFSSVLPGRGEARYAPAPGGFLVDSFFDVFLEISLDDGATWQTISDPIHMDVIPSPAGVVPLLGLAPICRRRRA